MKGKKYVLQENIKDCAVACLYNIIKYYKGNINMDKLRKKLGTNKEGTSVYDIVKVSNELGLEASAYECELNDLCDLKLPVIAHIRVDNKFDHFVIIDKIIDDEIIIFDPIRGYVKYELDDFDNEWTNIIITFKKTNNLVKEKNKNFIYDIIVHITKNSFLIIFIFIFSILSSILSIIHSLYFSYLYNQKSLSIKVFIFFTMICISKLIIDYIRNNKMLNYIKNFDFNITLKTYNKILSLQPIYHHIRPVGDIFSRINDLSSIKEFINNISFSFIIDFIYVLMISIILFIINQNLFIFLFLMSLIYILIYLIYRKQIVLSSNKVKEKSSNVNTYLIESIFGIDTIKNLNLEINRDKYFKNNYKNFLDENFALNKLIINLNLIQEFICNISIISLIFLSFILFYKKFFTIPSIIIFNTLSVYYFISLKNIISIDNILINAKNSYKRLIELYNEEDEKNIKKLENINNISIKNLSYSYNDITDILNNISFDINKNDKIFVKGKSGCGKSTIFKLLTKQLDIQKGTIKIDNLDIKDINRKDIVDNICYVSQNEYIFTDTLLNNIKLYKEANKEEIDKVIKITKIDEILKKRNITLDFLLEENGHNFSGGERQKIILARSLLQNKKILILDETLNELDIQSERIILKNIIKEYDITLILISHRDNNSDLFNKILKIGGTK